MREIACKLPAEYGETAVKTAWFDLAALDRGFALTDNKLDSVLLSGSTSGFVIAIPAEIPPMPGRSSGSRMTPTCQVTDDKSIMPVDEREW